MSNWRKVWEEHNGPIPKGMHIHHIIPRSEGGTDDIDNLQLVTPEEHYDIHFERGDYGACALISDGIEREAPTIGVVKFDLDGYRVRRFDSVTEALESVDGEGSGLISRCCRYKQISYKNHQWFYESEVGDLDYVGPVDRKRNNGGHNTKSNFILDTELNEVFKSKLSAKRRAFPDTKAPNGAANMIKDPRWIKITEEEYNILKQLENE